MYFGLLAIQLAFPKIILFSTLYVDLKEQRPNKCVVKQKKREEKKKRKGKLKYRIKITTRTAIILNIKILIPFRHDDLCDLKMSVAFYCESKVIPYATGSSLQCGNTPQILALKVASPWKAQTQKNVPAILGKKGKE